MDEPAIVTAGRDGAAQLSGVVAAPVSVSDAAPRIGDEAGPLSRVLDAKQTVLTAVILALVFRAFFIEAFVIPTGSMAETLLGAHGRHICRACGWEFDFGPSRVADTAEGQFIDPEEIVCPNCHKRFRPEPGSVVQLAGDRILVHKWPIGLGHLLEPQRWDVIVFRDPQNPQANYIKRVVGLPGEQVEIIDGDVFIDGLIVRKTAAAQEALWFNVYNQDHPPFDSDDVSQRPRWTVDASAAGPAPAWAGLETRVFRFDRRAGRESSIVFNRRALGTYLQDVYGYNHGSSGAYVGDVRLRAELTFNDAAGAIRVEMTQDEARFVLVIEPYGGELLTSPTGAAELRRIGAFSGEFRPGQPHSVELGHVDYRVYVCVDGREVAWTSGDEHKPDVDALRLSRAARRARLRITGTSGAFELRHICIERDVYYTGNTRRASAGDPFKLFADEFFVLGDNSPRSHDGREWTDRGPHLPDDYRVGTVRADQIVGRAAFVYLPALLALDERGRFRVPDVGRMRFIR